MAERLASQLGHSPRRLHEKATNISLPHSGQWKRTTP